MVIMISGLPGAGKSFFSRHLQMVIPARYLSTDTIREALGKKGDYSPEAKQQVYEQLIEKARKHLQKGRDVIVDATFHRSGRRAMVHQLATDTGHELIVVEVKASEETIRQRLKGSRQHSEADYAIYQKLRDEYEEPAEAHLILWSDVLSIDEMISLTKRRIYGSAADTATDR